MKNIFINYKNQLGAVAITFIVSTFVLAAPPTTPYNPNETLDPACAPGDTNCIVQILSGSDNLGNHTMTGNLLTNGNWISNDGGNEGIFVNNIGRIGINTSNPTNFADFPSVAVGAGTGGALYDIIDGTTRVSAFGWNRAQNQLQLFNLSSTGTLYIKNNSATPGLFLNSNNNVGIGTTSPLSRFDTTYDFPSGGGAPISGTGSDANAIASFKSTGGSTMDIGMISNGNIWLQGRYWGGVAGFQNLLFNPSGGNIGIGNLAPANKLEITHGTSGNSGLRFTNLTSASTAGTSNSKVLTVDANGDVILVTDAGGGSSVSVAEGYIGTFTKSLSNAVDTVIDTQTTVRNDFSTSFASGLWTVPAGKSGWYNLSANSSNPSANTDSLTYITVNGTDIGISSVTALSGAPGSQISGNYYLNAGDVVRVRVRQISGGTISVSGKFSIVRLGSIPASVAPSFSATRTTNQTITSSTYAKVLWNSENFDTANAFNTTTGEFTVPVAGKYIVTAAADVYNNTGIANGNTLTVYKNGSNISSQGPMWSNGTYTSANSLAVVIDAAVGDVIDIRIYSPNGTSILGGGNYFTASLLAGAVATVSSVDNLGNHTATQNIQLGSNWLSGDGGNEGIVVDSTGNVGIGTVSPVRKLDVAGSSRITGDSSSTALQLQPAANTWGMTIDGTSTASQSFGLRINAGTNSSDTPLQIKNSAQTLDFMTILGNGNVGIGAVSPTERLDLGGGNIKMGYERIVNTVAVGSAVNTWYKAVCTAGKQALGGSCTASDVAGPSVPSYIDTDGYSCYKSSSISGTITIVAVCANIK